MLRSLKTDVVLPKVRGTIQFERHLYKSRAGHDVSRVGHEASGAWREAPGWKERESLFCTMLKRECERIV